MEKINISNGFRLQWEEAQQCYVMLYPEGMVQLNPTAAEILKLCDGTKDASGIVQALEEMFNESNLAQDVQEFLEDVYGKGWITAK